MVTLIIVAFGLIFGFIVLCYMFNKNLSLKDKFQELSGAILLFFGFILFLVIGGFIFGKILTWLGIY